jgi:UDP-N-acetylglucosamine 2-epimerase (non-hydrolysing)
VTLRAAVEKYGAEKKVRMLGIKPLKVALVIGTRPEAIKMAPVIEEIRRRVSQFDPLLIVSGQHRQMLDQVLSFFQLKPDYDLQLMQPNQSLGSLTARALEAMDELLKKQNVDLVMVQGDTTTAFAASLTAFFHHVPVAHVEAGLRSRDVNNPFPEEINRRFTGQVTDLHFAPTPLAKQNLLDEMVPQEKIAVTGNTVVDALRAAVARPFSYRGSPLEGLPLHRGRVLLVTSHRRESWGAELENICLSLRDLAARFSDVQIVYPVHLNPNVRGTVQRLLHGTERIHLTDPLDWLTFVNLMQRSYLILTDSGGIQEEAPSFRKPVLVLRQLTERPEASMSGMARIVGTSREQIVDAASALLTDEREYQAMSSGRNPYGDGRAACRIVKALQRWAAGERQLLRPEEEFIPDWTSCSEVTTHLPEVAAGAAWEAGRA